MCVVPLALFGGMLALNVRGMTLNVSSAVGFIALFGVAIQNGVIMISHINMLRRQEGEDLKQAVIDGHASPVPADPDDGDGGRCSDCCPPRISAGIGFRRAAPAGDGDRLWVAVRYGHHIVCASGALLPGRASSSGA